MNQRAVRKSIYLDTTCLLFHGSDAAGRRGSAARYPAGFSRVSRRLSLRDGPGPPSSVLFVVDKLNMDVSLGTADSVLRVITPLFPGDGEERSPERPCAQVEARSGRCARRGLFV